MLNQLQQHLAGSDRWGVWMYHPEGSHLRSGTSDGRGADQKYSMRWAYDGPTPIGAPHPRTT